MVSFDNSDAIEIINVLCRKKTNGEVLLNDNCFIRICILFECFILDYVYMAKFSISQEQIRLKWNVQQLESQFSQFFFLIAFERGH